MSHSHHDQLAESLTPNLHHHHGVNAPQQYGYEAAGCIVTSWETWVYCTCVSVCDAELALLLSLWLCPVRRFIGAAVMQACMQNTM